MVAYNADGSTVTPQTTTYLYTSAVNASWQTGVVYPDTAAPANFRKRPAEHVLRGRVGWGSSAEIVSA